MSAHSIRCRAWVVALLLLVTLACTREWMQSQMARHMLLQMPALAITGWWLHRAGGVRLQALLAPWNHYGLAGLILIQCLAAFWMVPRALDLALSSLGMELAKYMSWMFAGAMLRQSMLQSNTLVQLFMLGNFTLMIAAVSDLYASAPNRLCNFYGMADQAVTARGLWIMLVVVGAAWVLRIGLTHPFADDLVRFGDSAVKPESMR